MINRAARKSRLFQADGDYQAFEDLLAEAIARFPDIALFAYCVMPNHWHFVIASRADRVLSRFMHWLTTTHARRWQTVRGLDGHGAVYQGRFKAIPVQEDRHFLWICRYVERNPLRAALVARAEDWRWSSRWHRHRGDDICWLSQWPIQTPPDWGALVNTPQTRGELEAVRAAVKHGAPFGDEHWRTDVLQRLGKAPGRGRGRPRRVVVATVL